MDKNKIFGIISIILCILGWILYSKVGIIIALIIEIIAIVLAIVSTKKQKNVYGTIGIIGSTILIVIMLIVLLGNGVTSNTGNDALIRKSQEIQQRK